MRDTTLTKPPGALGRLEGLVEWICGWQAKHPPTLDRCRMAVFAGNHGVTAEGVSAFPPDVTQQMIGNFNAGGAAINQLCALTDADMRLGEGSGAALALMILKGAVACHTGMATFDEANVSGKSPESG